MEFEIKRGQIYGARNDDLILKIIDVDDINITWQTLYPEGVTYQTKVLKSFFIDMYDQEKYWLSWPLDVFHKYEWPRIEKRNRGLI
ncbi:hypothetical protein ERX27_07595 [Macrococcus brunensis]|uniref:Uncharacterized protein n=1 Tax=Macrococcus brunensis TaxID=198483 RepID=A0A4R6BCX1_9STAP|nr:hypothetical protein [Macrococcus brunensis]TDL96710.1 hypothetical protein ERX27_07595 [Macrococcus brunensis]